MRPKHLRLQSTRGNEDRSQPPVPWGARAAWYLQVLPIPWPTNIISISHVSFSIASPVLQQALKSNQVTSLLIATNK